MLLSASSLYKLQRIDMGSQGFEVHRLLKQRGFTGGNLAQQFLLGKTGDRDDRDSVITHAGGSP